MIWWSGDFKTQEFPNTKVTSSIFPKIGLFCSNSLQNGDDPVTGKLRLNYVIHYAFLRPFTAILRTFYGVRVRYVPDT